MDVIKKILQYNQKFIHLSHEKFDKLPKWHTAIISCMDTRLVNFLEPAMGIERGDVKIIKNAGNIVTATFNDVIKSLLVCIYELSVKEIIVVGHNDCGMENTTALSLKNKMLEHNISNSDINNIMPDLKDWADNFHTPEENIITSVKNIKNSPYLPKNIPVHGFLLNINTGKLTLLTE